MMKFALKFSFVFALFAVSFLTSCDKTSTAEEIEVFVDEALLRVAESASVGADGCYELVFPVTIEFADGTTAEVGSVEEMKEAFRTWKENNPDSGRGDHPTLVFPVELLSPDGDLITVGSKEEIKELQRAAGCERTHRPGRGNRGCSCFQIVFPVTIQFPDGTTVEIGDRGELKSTIREWKQNNPDASERPQLVFPITVELEDGTTVTVDSLEALRELKQDCAG